MGRLVLKRRYERLLVVERCGTQTYLLASQFGGRVSAGIHRVEIADLVCVVHEMDLDVTEVDAPTGREVGHRLLGA